MNINNLTTYDSPINLSMASPTNQGGHPNKLEAIKQKNGLIQELSENSQVIPLSENAWYIKGDGIGIKFDCDQENFRGLCKELKKFLRLKNKLDSENNESIQVRNESPNGPVYYRLTFKVWDEIQLKWEGKLEELSEEQFEMVYTWSKEVSEEVRDRMYYDVGGLDAVMFGLITTSSFEKMNVPTEGSAFDYIKSFYIHDARTNAKYKKHEIPLIEDMGEYLRTFIDSVGQLISKHRPKDLKNFSLKWLNILLRENASKGSFNSKKPKINEDDFYWIKQKINNKSTFEEDVYIDDPNNLLHWALLMQINQPPIGQFKRFIFELIKRFVLEIENNPSPISKNPFQSLSAMVSLIDKTDKDEIFFSILKDEKKINKWLSPFFNEVQVRFTLDVNENMQHEHDLLDLIWGVIFATRRSINMLKKIEYFARNFKNIQLEVTGSILRYKILIRSYAENKISHALIFPLEGCSEEIQNICKEVMGNNPYATLVALLLDESSQDFINWTDSFDDVLEKVGLPSEQFVLGSKINVMTLGAVLNKILLMNGCSFDFERKYLNNLKRIFTHLYKQGCSLDFLSVDRETIDFIRENYCETYPSVRTNNRALILMMMMTSLDEETRLCVVLDFIKRCLQLEKPQPNRHHDIFSLLAYVEEKSRKRILLDIFRDREKYEVFIAPHLSFSEVLVQWNRNVVTYSDVLIRNLTNLLTMNHLDRKLPFAEKLAGVFSHGSPQENHVFGKSLQMEQNDHLFGRTIWRDGIAYKIKKREENDRAFCREKEIILILKESGIFSSHFPEPISIKHRSINQINKTSSFSIGQEKSFDEVDIPSETCVYKFKVDRSYYHYLHQQTDVKKYNEARKMWLQDSLQLIRNGFFHESTPMFHNFSQNRPYIIFAKLLHASSSISGSTTAGRLDHWRLYNQFPNVGTTGLRDWGDIKEIAEIAKNPFLFSGDLDPKIPAGFTDVFRDVKQRTALLTANFIATCFLVDMLLLCMYLENDKNFKWDWTDNNCRNRLIDELKKGMVLIIKSYVGKALEEQEINMIIQSMIKHGIDWDQCAKEILFWATPDQPDSYSDYIDTNKVPKDLYKQGCSVDLSQAKNHIETFGFGDDEFVRQLAVKKGCMIKDLRQDATAKLYLDLGAYNSSFLLHTFENLCYLTATIAMILAEME